MAAVTGSLVVELGLNTAKLVTGMKKAERRISDFSKKAKVMAKRIAKIGAAATAAAAVGLFALAKNVANIGDKFQKMSISLGVSTKALSSLKFAAELSGASMQDVEKALKTVAKRANDAQAGLSTAVRSFEQLGISIEDTEGNLKSVDVLLVESADAFAKMTDNTKAAALAQELFGKSGVNLLPLLKQGSKGIKAMQEEAEKLGITFSKAAADDAAQFNDQMLRVQNVILGIKNQIGQALIPVITDLLDKILAWTSANRGLIDVKIKAFIEDAVPVVKALAEGIIFVTNTIGSMLVAVSDAAAFWGEFSVKVEDFVRGTFKVTKTFLVDKFSAVVNTIKSLLNTTIGFWKSFKDNVVRIAMETFMGIKSWLLDKFTGVVDGVKAALDKMIGFFSNLKEKVVGKSIIPDMVNAVIAEIQRMDRGMKQAISGSNNFFSLFEGMTSSLESGFSSTIDSVINTALSSLGGGSKFGLVGDLFNKAVDFFTGGDKVSAPVANAQQIQKTVEQQKKLLKENELQAVILENISVSSSKIAESMGLLTETFTNTASPFSPGGFSALLDSIGRVVLTGIQKFSLPLFGIVAPLASFIAQKGLIGIDERRIDRAVKGIAEGLKKVEDQVLPKEFDKISKEVITMGEKINNVIQPFGGKIISFFENIERTIVGAGEFLSDKIESFFSSIFGGGGPTDILSAFGQPGGTFTGTEPGFIGPAVNPSQVIINVEGSIITEQDLVQTVRDGIDILNEDVFDASKFGEFAGVT